MTIKVGINGFGRIGRLALRAAFDWDGIEKESLLIREGMILSLFRLMILLQMQTHWLTYSISTQFKVLGSMRQCLKIMSFTSMVNTSSAVRIKASLRLTGLPVML